MFASVKEWIVSILLAAFIVNIAELILPDSKIKKYVKLVLNFIFIFIVITPALNLFNNRNNIDDKVLKSFTNYDNRYKKSAEGLSEKTGINNNIESSFQSELKQILEYKLGECGYQLESIKMNGSKVEDIKIKEKSSNKKNQTNIKSNDNSNSRRVFNNKNKKSSDIKKDDLKDELVKSLNISVDEIHIDE